ncbi:hypothetical protein CEE67_04795 [Limosilactobacillus fermentum]|nr:hypothetical protein CEE67_04795 [Limosilactobacillus fermentum]
MGTQHELMPGAMAMLKQAQRLGYQLGIITNGVAKVQKSRLSESGLAPLFSSVLVSETVGVEKPDPVIFERFFATSGVTPTVTVANHQELTDLLTQWAHA